mmetsp:Transcript_25026/g.72002  ORF Transcript_25026/g.72002 Transcript_25026/m.72002 type:complete len:247 (-) Transcript_25026:477-1217(-)
MPRLGPGAMGLRSAIRGGVGGRSTIPVQREVPVKRERLNVVAQKYLRTVRRHEQHLCARRLRPLRRTLRVGRRGSDLEKLPVAAASRRGPLRGLGCLEQGVVAIQCEGLCGDEVAQPRHVVLHPQRSLHEVRRAVGAEVACNVLCSKDILADLVGRTIYHDLLLRPLTVSRRGAPRAPVRGHGEASAQQHAHRAAHDGRAVIVAHRRRQRQPLVAAAKVLLPDESEACRRGGGPLHEGLRAAIRRR